METNVKWSVGKDDIFYTSLFCSVQLIMLKVLKETATLKFGVK